MLSFPAKGSTKVQPLYPRPERRMFGTDEEHASAVQRWEDKGASWHAVAVEVEILDRPTVLRAQYEHNAIMAEEAEASKAGQRVPIETIERGRECARSLLSRCLRKVHGAKFGGETIDEKMSPERRVQLLEDADMMTIAYFAALVAQEVRPEDKQFPASAGVE